jgi:hypothetical protein
MATRKRHTPWAGRAQAGPADRMLADGKDIGDVCRELQISEQT